MSLPDNEFRRLQSFVSESMSANTSDDRLGQIAIRSKIVTAPQLRLALRDLEIRRQEGQVVRIGEILIGRSLLTPSKLRELLTLQEAERKQAEGTCIGKYRLKRLLGQGGMATVYEAEDPSIARTVALKVLWTSRAGPNLVDRFHREAGILAQVHDPSIVTIYDFGTVRGHPGESCHYIAMEFVEGDTLEDLLSAKRTPRNELLSILEKAARAAGVAHRQGIVHRDIKPTNIMVEFGGRVVLTDFGLAHADWYDTRLTRTNVILGTPRYMAPEQVEGRVRNLSPRTDVFGLGSILYEILTGDVPFAAPTVTQQYHRILGEEPIRPRRSNRRLSRDLESICLKALEKKMENRYPTASEFAEDLARVRRGEPVRARSARLSSRALRWVSRHAIAILVGLLLTGTSAGLLATILLYRKTLQGRRQDRIQERNVDRILNEAEYRLEESTRRIDSVEGTYLEVVDSLRGAERLAREAMEISPTLARGPWVMAHIQELLGRHEEAVTYYRKTLSLDPNHPGARYRLGRALLLMGLRRSPSADVEVLDRTLYQSQVWIDVGGG